jgi:RNA recognition motif-containing protein
MEEGTKSKKTVFVGGIGDDVDESVIYEHFTTFGTGMLANTHFHRFLNAV